MWAAIWIWLMQMKTFTDLNDKLNVGIFIEVHKSIPTSEKSTQ